MLHLLQKLFQVQKKTNLILTFLTVEIIFRKKLNFPLNKNKQSTKSNNVKDDFTDLSQLFMFLLVFRTYHKSVSNLYQKY